MAQLLINIVLKGRFGGQFVDYNASLMLNTRTHWIRTRKLTDKVYTFGKSK